MILDNWQYISSKNLKQISNGNDLFFILLHFLNEKELAIVDNKVKYLKETIDNSNAEIDSTVLSILSKELKETEFDGILAHIAINQRIDNIIQVLNGSELSYTQRRYFEKELENFKTVDKNIQKTRNFNQNLKRLEELQEKVKEAVLAKYKIEELKKEIEEFYILRFRQNLESVVTNVKRGLFVSQYADKTFLNLLKKYSFADSVKEREKLLLEMEKRLNELFILSKCELVWAIL